MAEAIGFRSNRLPMLVLIAGIIGGVGGFALQYYASVVDYPLNSGGRPFNSWAAFIPVTLFMPTLAEEKSDRYLGICPLYPMSRLLGPGHLATHHPAD